MQNPFSENGLLSSGIDRLSSGKRRSHNGQNISQTEVWVSSLAGSGLVAYGLRKRSLPLAILGGALTYRGLTRHCPIYEAAGINRNGPTSERSVVTIQRPPEEVYRFCSDFQNFPQFVTFLEDVRPADGNRQRWKVQPPMGGPREFTVEVYERSEPRALRWRTLEDAPIQLQGSLEFEPGWAEKSTRVRAVADFGRGGRQSLLSRVAQPFAKYKLRHDLRRLKQIVEAGEVITVEGQTSGREARSGDFEKESSTTWRTPEQAREEAAAHP